ncbi:MAG: NAD(+) synthase [Candidatus Woesearchaeota archaeon]
MALERILLPEMDPEKVAGEIGEFIVAACSEVGATGVVIGLSGGVDSTTTAALAADAFRKQAAGLEVVGYILPTKLNAQADTLDGISVAKNLGIRYEVLDLEPIVEAHKCTNPEAFRSNYEKGNMISRIRANILSTKAATERKIVMGTGNKDEDFGVGYYTLFGDGAVHMSPIGNLPKRLVRQMARHYGFNGIAGKEPSAGLEPGQTDFKDLGYSFDSVEIVLEGLRQGFTSEQLYIHPQVRKCIEHELGQKFNSVDAAVNDIIRRHYEIAIPKMKIIHPEAAKVTLIYR